MKLIYGVSQVMHRIRVKLYPNYLPGYEKTFIARTSNEASLSVEQVCAALRDRGGFTGSYSDLVEYVKAYFDEAAYQLCDGFSVNTGYFSIHPNLGGVLQNEHDVPNPEKNPLTMRFRALAPFRKLAESVSIVVEGIADASGYIDEFLDHESDSANGVYRPGNQFVLSGHKVKIAGDDPSCGMYFADESGGGPVKVMRLVENNSSKLIGIIPETVWEHSRIEIRTQYGGSSTVFLKTPRVITSKFVLERVQSVSGA